MTVRIVGALLSDVGAEWCITHAEIERLLNGIYSPNNEKIQINDDN